MKIDTTRLEPVAGTPNTGPVGKPSGSGKAGAPGDVEDSVALSPIGMLAAKIDIPEERLQELRRQVADGSYQVDAQKITEKIVQSMLEK